ncbi:MAG: extracellular solute-binding protein [Treponema sp.]|nr:extracellular solute-binding protein [Treponema sp.]
MSRKKILIVCIVLLSLLICTMPVFSQQVPRASSAIQRTLRGMNIIIGNWWSDYNVNTRTTSNDSEERELDYRRRLLREYNFTLQEKQVAGWGEMPQVAATSIMAGRPVASVFVLQPDWALTLYRQNLLYPVGKSRAVNWTATTPIEWNRSVTQAFTFTQGRNTYAYAFANGYGGSMHAAVVFWNKRLYREAGLDPNLPYDLQRAGTWTWDRFFEISKQLTRDVNNDGIIDYYAMPRDLSTEILDALVSSNGANYVDRDARTGRLVNATGRPEFAEAINFFMRLKNEGVLMDRPDGSNWDWHMPAFVDGKAAMLIDNQYKATGDLRSMRDEWGMVLPPKGPRSRNYVVFSDENVMVIPAEGFTDAQVDAILWAVQSWQTPVDTDWKIGQYPNYRDRRAVDETVALIRNQSLWKWKYHLHVPGLNRGQGLAWDLWFHDGDPAQLTEAISQTWNALIADANGL